MTNKLLSLPRISKVKAMVLVVGDLSCCGGSSSLMTEGQWREVVPL